MVAYLLFQLIIWANFCVCGFLIALLVCISSGARRRAVPIEGSVVVVTGGTSGIGLQVVKQCIKLRAKVVVIVSRGLNTESEANSLLSKGESLPGATRVAWRDCDLTKAEKIADTFQWIRDNFQGVDILVNAAGSCHCDYVMRLTPKEMQHMLDLNALGTILSTQEALVDIRGKGTGALVFLSSQGGQTGVVGFSGYSASKYAVRGFAESLRMELQEEAINLICVFPASTDTPGLQSENQRKPEETRVVEGTSGLFSAADIAETICEAIVRGRNSDLSVGFIGYLLWRLNIGFGRSPSLLVDIIGSILMPIPRFLAMLLTEIWGWQIRQHQRSNPQCRERAFVSLQEWEEVRTSDLIPSNLSATMETLPDGE